MPVDQPTSFHLNGRTISLGEPIALGVLNHSEAEIIEFARLVDPLPIHTDPESARKSIFGGIVASGSMLYLDAHRRWFIPMWGSSIICGLGVRNWNFRKPHFPDTPIAAQLTPRAFIPDPARNSLQVEWYYEFHAEDGTLVQDLELPVLHWWKGK
jgi:acyl dehydratase